MNRKLILKVPDLSHLVRIWPIWSQNPPILLAGMRITTGPYGVTYASGAKADSGMLDYLITTDSFWNLDRIIQDLIIARDM